MHGQIAENTNVNYSRESSPAKAPFGRQLIISEKVSGMKKLHQITLNVNR